jgi:hypothetical protein
VLSMDVLRYGHVRSHRQLAEVHDSARHGTGDLPREVFAGLERLRCSLAGPHHAWPCLHRALLK